MNQTNNEQHDIPDPITQALEMVSETTQALTSPEAWFWLGMHEANRIGAEAAEGLRGRVLAETLEAGTVRALHNLRAAVREGKAGTGQEDARTPCEGRWSNGQGCLGWAARTVEAGDGPAHLCHAHARLSSEEQDAPASRSLRDQANEPTGPCSYDEARAQVRRYRRVMDDPDDLVAQSRKALLWLELVHTEFEEHGTDQYCDDAQEGLTVILRAIGERLEAADVDWRGSYNRDGR